MDAGTLRVMSTNVRGFKTNADELTHFALEHHIDIVLAVETFLDSSCVTTCDKIPGYPHWAKHDRQRRQGGGVAACYRDGLRVDALEFEVPEEMKMFFLRIIVEGRGAILLCTMYRPQWQGNAPLVHLRDHLDDVMATNNS